MTTQCQDRTQGSDAERKREIEKEKERKRAREKGTRAEFSSLAWHNNRLALLPTNRTHQINVDAATVNERVWVLEGGLCSFRRLVRHKSESAALA